VVAVSEPVAELAAVAGSGPPTGRDAARTAQVFEDFLATIEGA
jgi:hypothetical protein